MASKTFASGTSDSRAHKNDLAWARRHGLEEREAELAARDKRRHKAVLAADRASVRMPTLAEPASLAQAEATPVTVASLPEEKEGAVSVSASTSMYSEFVDIDPEWAKRAQDAPMPIYKGKRLEQRTIKRSKLEFLVGVIERREWKTTHQGIALATTGGVLDGQHRLQAVIDTGATVRCQVTYNCPPEMFLVVDTHAARTGGDVLQILGKPSSSHLSSSAKLWHCYEMWLDDPDEAGHWTNWNRLRPSHIQTVQVIMDNPDLEGVANLARSAARAVHAPDSSLAVFRYAATRAWPTDRGLKRFEEFWDQLITGEMVVKGDPAKTVREWLISYYKKPMAAKRERTLLGLLKAWNAFARNEELKYIRTPREAVMVRPYQPQSVRAAAAKLAAE